MKSSPPGGDAAYLRATCLPLGIEPAGMAVDKGRLNPGEMLLLFTDGWTDVPDQSGQVLGLEEFGKRVSSAWAQSAGASAADLIERIMLSIDEGPLDCPAGDDRTFLAVRRV
jgi:serine phosphatase RsbU (regulator of sigma subunit)